MEWRPLSRENDPNPWDAGCREPERYHIRAAGTTEQEVGDFLWGLVRVLQPRIVVETGTADGDTTERIGQALVANGHGRCVTVERGPQRAARARRRLVGLPVTALCDDVLVLDWARVIPMNRQVDMAFIDASTERAREFMWLRPFLAPGAFVAFHDTGNGLAVGDDVRKLARDGVLIETVHIPCPRGLTVGRVA
jgi:predicted O-methyltransferase YrrM